MEGGVSCRKLLLVDVFSEEKSYAVRRVYAIIDEQSNSFLISTELADELAADGLEEKYFLTTCRGTKEIKYGVRVTDVVVQSFSGAAADLPTLIECGNVPQEKREIPKGTPWAQKLSLGWTIIGQKCLDLAGGHAHVLVRRTNLLSTSLTDPRRRMVQPQCCED